MADRGTFLLRTDPKVLEALRRWSRDELRSVNGQIDYILRKALRDAGRLRDLVPDAGNDVGNDASNPSKKE